MQTDIVMKTGKMSKMKTRTNTVLLGIDQYWAVSKIIALSVLVFNFLGITIIPSQLIIIIIIKINNYESMVCL